MNLRIKARVPLYLILHKGLSWLLWLKYPSSLSGEYLDIFAGKPRDNFNASPGKKKENLWVLAPTGCLRPTRNARNPSYFLCANTLEMCCASSLAGLKGPEAPHNEQYTESDGTEGFNTDRASVPSWLLQRAAGLDLKWWRCAGKALWHMPGCERL